MSPEKEKALIDLAPNLFYRKEEEGARQMPSFLFGCECGDGWFSILAEALSKISKLALDGGLDIRIDQIKEKYGFLRIYLSTETDEMSDIISWAEDESMKTCEKCGSPGKIREKNRWCYASCDEHVH